MEIADDFGHITQIPLGSYSPGYSVVSRQDAIRRKRPVNLRDPSSLTGWGIHQRVRRVSTPITLTYPYGSHGYIKYVNMSPGNYAPGAGLFFNPPSIDWQVKLRLAVKDQKVNMAQTVAEYRQTQDLFANVARDVVKVFHGLRRGDIKSVFETLKIKPRQLRGTLANRWLELRYGWMPLLQDLHGSVEELKLAMQRPRFQVIVKTMKETTEETRDLGQMPDGTHGTLWGSWTVRAKVKAYLRIDSHLETRLGITNPMNLAWELLPYSFVIDWLIPIGDWLNSLDAGIGLTDIYGTVSWRNRYLSTSTFGSQIYVIEEYSRSVFTALPDAPLPRWSPSVGWGRVANAIALLTQLKR